EEAHLDAKPAEEAQQPPAADPRAVFKHRLGQGAAQAIERRLADVVERAFGMRVALLNRMLAAALEIDADIDGDARPAGPLPFGRVGAIADKIAVVGHSAALRRLAV